MDEPRFVYVTYISTSPEKLWNALISVRNTVKHGFIVDASFRTMFSLDILREVKGLGFEVDSWQVETVVN